MSFEDNRSSQEAGTDLEQPVEVSTLTSGTPESSDMSNLLAGMETLSAAPLVPGEVVQGKVLKVADGEVVVDLGLKTEATAPFAEFLNSEGQVSVAPGDTVDIWIEQYDEVTGRVEISHQKAVRRKVWEDIERAFQEQTNDHRAGDRPHQGWLDRGRGSTGFSPRISRRYPGAPQR